MTRNGKAAATYSVPALEKGLEVLEFLAKARQPLGLQQIAQALQRSCQELFRIMVCLHAHGYLLRDDAARYRLSSKLFEVGSLHFAHQALVTTAMPLMEELAVTSGETCQLSIVERDRLLVIATATGSNYLQLGVKVGTSIPVHNSVIGLVAMACLGEDRLGETWRHRQEIIEDGSDVYLRELRKYEDWLQRLREVRSAGFLIASSPMHPGSLVHAAPVMDSMGQLVAILSLTRLLPAEEPRARAAFFKKSLLGCANSISSRLGAQVRPTTE